MVPIVFTPSRERTKDGGGLEMHASRCEHSTGLVTLRGTPAEQVRGSDERDDAWTSSPIEVD